MRVSVDRVLCTGHARCWSVAPALFTVDDDGYSSIGSGVAVAPGDEELARLAVASCPERALRIDAE